MALRILLMGTGEFALPAFEALMKSEHQVVGLVTQPDRAGAGHHQHINPLKSLAESRQIPVFQPVNVKTPESLDQLKTYQADLFVVAAYGQILSADLLKIAPLGAINLHGSLLPKYRGAAPIQYAVWKGETETGVTIFQIEPKLDAGPMYGTVVTPIDKKDTSGTVHDRLAQLAVDLTLEVVSGLENGTLTGVLQTPGAVTRAPRLKKEFGLLDWNQSAPELDCQVRAMQPWPMPFTFLHVPERKPQRVLILDIEHLEIPSRLADALPGTIHVFENEIVVRIGTEAHPEAVKICRIQPAGKRSMTAAEFLNGTSLKEARFGPEA